jgi:hypothetical protein
MMRFVETPNLPVCASTVIIGEKYCNILQNGIKSLGINALFMPDNPYVDDRLSGHADLSVLHLGGNRLLLAPYLKRSSFSQQLEDRGFDIRFADIEQSALYPNDAQMNVCILGDKVIYNPKTVPDTIVKYLTIENGAIQISSRQGYSRCSVCVVNDNAIITADEGICRSAKAHGIDVLKIMPGYIDLPGFDYGFVGGASFKISDTKLAFTGGLDRHPDAEQIIEFTSLHNVDIVYITDKPAFDIGGAIPITEASK